MLAATPAGGPPAEELTCRSAQIRALLAIAFLFPVVMCAVFFPSPAGDLREHINLGLSFRLYAFSQPPLQTWLAGAVALTGARDAWFFVAVAQALNFAGLAYLALIARNFLGAGTVVPLVIMFCGSLYYSQATPSMALNADQIQVPLWAGILYHGLAALRDDRWRDWLVCGALVGVTVLAKYTVLLLVAALVIALASIPAYRRTFANPKLYAAGLFSLPFIALHAVPELSRGYSLDYASGQFRPHAPAAVRAAALWEFVRSYLIYGSPILIGLAALVQRKAIALRRPQEPAQQLIVLAFAIYVAFILLLIVALGLGYATRHSFPLFGLSLLVLLALVRFDPSGLRAFANVMLALWGIIIVGGLVYAQVAVHTVLREPGPAAAAALRAEWDRQFSCGPAYVVGDDNGARLIAINFGRPVLGLAFADTVREDWFDRGRLNTLGAIVATTPAHAAANEFAHWFKGRSTESLSLPYRRTFSTRRHVYVYYFIAPQDCPADAK